MLKKRGWDVLASNVRFKVGEVDLFASDPFRKRFVLVEVRGRTRSTFQPSRMISPAKVRRLKTLAKLIQRRKNAPVHILLLECVTMGDKIKVKEYPIENY